MARARGYLRLGSARVASERWRCAGAVAIWGRVVEAQHGWRGVLAYPRRLVVPPSDGLLSTRRRARLAARIAADLEAYGVAVELGAPLAILSPLETGQAGEPDSVSLTSGIRVR